MIISYDEALVSLRTWFKQTEWAQKLLTSPANSRLCLQDIFTQAYREKQEWTLEKSIAWLVLTCSAHGGFDSHTVAGVMEGHLDFAKKFVPLAPPEAKYKDPETLSLPTSLKEMAARPEIYIKITDEAYERDVYLCLYNLGHRNLSNNVISRTVFKATYLYRGRKTWVDNRLHWDEACRIFREEFAKDCKKVYQSLYRLSKKGEPKVQKPSKVEKAIDFKFKQAELLSEIRPFKDALQKYCEDLENGTMNQSNINELYWQFEQLQRLTTDLKSKNKTFVCPSREETAAKVLEALEGTK